MKKMNIENCKDLLSLLREGVLLRAHENRSSHLTMENGILVYKESDSSSGVSALVRRGHSVFFGSAPGINSVSAEKAVDKAIALSTSCRDCFPIPALESMKGEYCSAGKSVGTAEKLGFMRSVDEYIAARSKRMIGRRIDLGELAMDKFIASDEGISFRSLNMRWSLTVSVMAETPDGDTVSCEALLSGEGTADSVISLPKKLRERLDSLVEAVEKKRFGKKVPAGKTVCILAPDPACMLVHEAIGHTTEGDMVLSGSAAMRLHGKKIASDIVTLGDFATEMCGEKVPQPIYIDDEGVRARDAMIIENGILTGYMHDRDSAADCSCAPTGNARAFEYKDTPIIRMRNTCIMPGNSTLEQMISSVDDGLYLVQAGMGQADTTGEFMIAIIEGYRIKNGRLEDAIMDTVCTGRAFEMMQTVDMIGDTIGWDVGGLCGKGQPMVTAAGSPALRCKITIGG